MLTRQRLSAEGANAIAATIVHLKTSDYKQSNTAAYPVKFLKLPK